MSKAIKFGEKVTSFFLFLVSLSWSQAGFGAVPDLAGVSLWSTRTMAGPRTEAQAGQTRAAAESSQRAAEQAQDMRTERDPGARLRRIRLSRGNSSTHGVLPS